MVNKEKTEAQLEAVNRCGTWLDLVVVSYSMLLRTWSRLGLLTQKRE